MKYIEQYQSLLAKRLSKKRYDHSFQVAKTAHHLAKVYGISAELAQVAGFLHDYARELCDRVLLEVAERADLITHQVEYVKPLLLHGKVGAHLLMEAGLVEDQQILDAIACHTTGRADLTTLGKIIYIADYIEPGRTYPGVEIIRSKTKTSLDHGIVMGIDNTLAHLLQRGDLIHPDTIAFRNQLLAGQHLDSGH